MEDNDEIQDDIFADYIAENLSPDNLKTFGTHTMKNYTEVERVDDETRRPSVPMSPQTQAQKIVNYWMNNSPNESADKLMKAVQKLKNMNLTRNFHELLTEIKAEIDGQNLRIEVQDQELENLR